MKNKNQSLQTIIFLFAIAGLAAALQAAPSVSPINGKKKCMMAGGEWGVFSKHNASQNIYTCRFLAKDAEKPCRNGKDCSTARCEYFEETKKIGCSQYPNEMGCHTYVKDGVPQSKICKD